MMEGTTSKEGVSSGGWKRREHDPILDDCGDSASYTLDFTKYPTLFALYEVAQKSYWTDGELDFREDAKEWPSLTEDTQWFIKNTLAFFASSDAIVNENLATRFYEEVKVAEARLFYGYQIMIENIHWLSYTSMITSLIPSLEEQAMLKAGIQTMPAVKQKAGWAVKWLNSGRSFHERLVAFVCVEGICFSSSFCSIGWLKTKGRLPGLTFANDKIAPDEALHCAMGVELYRLLREKLPEEIVRSIVTEAVEVEISFVTQALPVRLIGMNADLMCQYVRFVADVILSELGCKRMYNVVNPFPFMDLFALDGITSFFEKRNPDYVKSASKSRDSTPLVFDSTF